MSAKLNNYLFEKYVNHLVDPSPWPIMTLIAVFQCSLFFYFFSLGLGVYYIILTLIPFFLYIWFSDIKVKYNKKGNYINFGMALFVIYEIMFFFAFSFMFKYYLLNESISLATILDFHYYLFLVDLIIILSCLIFLILLPKLFNLGKNLYYSDWGFFFVYFLCLISTIIQILIVDIDMGFLIFFLPPLIWIIYGVVILIFTIYFHNCHLILYKVFSIGLWNTLENWLYKNGHVMVAMVPLIPKGHAALVAGNLAYLTLAHLDGVSQGIFMNPELILDSLEDASEKMALKGIDLTQSQWQPEGCRFFHIDFAHSFGSKLKEEHMSSGPRYWADHLKSMRELINTPPHTNESLPPAMNAFVASDVFLGKHIPGASGRIENYIGVPGNLPLQDSKLLGEVKTINSTSNLSTDIILCSLSDVNNMENSAIIKEALCDSAVNRLSGLISPIDVENKLVCSVERDDFIISLNEHKISSINRSILVNHIDNINPSARINIFLHNNVEYHNLVVLSGFDGEAIATHLENGNLRLGSVLRLSKFEEPLQTVNLRMSKKILLELSSFTRNPDSNDLHFLNCATGSFIPVPLRHA